jgi:hypothetical protein
MANKNLTSAKNAKNDEFYTQYEDIQKEVNAYLEYDPDVFRGKTILLPCDDPYESSFFKFFASKFNRFGLKKLIATSFAGSPIAGRQLSLPGLEPPVAKNGKGRGFVIKLTEVSDVDQNGVEDINDVKALLEANPPHELEGDMGYPPGDFRSSEIAALRDEADIIITNPPFSLFREFLAWINPLEKQFLVIGNMNAITYKEVFPLIKNNNMWLGVPFQGGNAFFHIVSPREYANGVYNENTGLVKFRNCCWFTNLDHGRRHQPLELMTMADNLKYNNHKGKVVYPHYDNYDAIEVPFTDAIPNDYSGVMGVPISFLDKYNPDQFEILGMCENGDLYNLKTKAYSNQEKKDAYFVKFGKSGQYDLNASGVIIKEGQLEKVYQRILIQHKEALAQ